MSVKWYIQSYNVLVYSSILPLIKSIPALIYKYRSSVSTYVYLIDL